MESYGDDMPEFSDITYDDLNGEEVKMPHDIPIGDEWHLPYIYQKSQTGGILSWKIGFNPLNNKLVIKEGYEIKPNGDTGKLRNHERKVELNSRSINMKSQALQEAWDRYQNKYRNGYRPAHESPVEKIQPQRAPNIIDKETGKWRVRDNHYMKGVSCQGKIDGIRAIIWPDDMDFISRGNKKLKWLIHIKKELEILFMYLPDNSAIDGELYNPNFEFGKIQTAVMTTTICHKTNKEMSFYIFDIIIPETVLEERTKILYEAFGKYLDDGNKNNTFIILPQYYAYSKDKLNKIYDLFIENKYEGMMIRKLSGINIPNYITTENDIKESWYRGKKNQNLLKMKPFIEDEGIIIDVISAKGRDEGTAIFVIEWKYRTFRCRPTGKFSDRKHWYDNKKDIIGKIYTFKYFETSDKGIPRFPTGKSFRDEDYTECEGEITNITFNDDYKDIIIPILSLMENIHNNTITCIPSKFYDVYHSISSDDVNDYTKYIGSTYKFKYIELDDSTNIIGCGFKL